MRALRDDRRIALLGVAGPLIFFVGVILVSWVERDFMDKLGWDQWPSGTALGPHGWITVVTFLLTGICQIAFGTALFAQAGDALIRKVGPAVLMLSGLGMVVLVFKTDREGGEETWHGLLHAIGYMTFFFPLLVAYVLLAWGSWNRLDRSTWKYAPVALVPWLGVFLLPEGANTGNYLFFAVLMTPLEILALRTFFTGGWRATPRNEVSATSGRPAPT